MRVRIRYGSEISEWWGNRAVWRRIAGSKGVEKNVER